MTGKTKKVAEKLTVKTDETVVDKVMLNDFPLQETIEGLQRDNKVLKTEVNSLQKDNAVFKTQVLSLQKADLAKNAIMPNITNALDQMSVRMKINNDAQVNMGVELGRLAAHLSDQHNETERLKQQIQQLKE